MNASTPRRLWAFLVGVGVVLTMYAIPARAWIDLENVDPTVADYPDGIHVVDGSYVMNASELQINITNHGLIGSQFSTMATYADAPSGQWPAGTGNEYLWAAGLWIGGVLNERHCVSTGQFERELRPLADVRATIYESINGVVTRPEPNVFASGRRLPDANSNDDGDRWTDEEMLNGLDDDGDGKIDEDYAQLGTQMMVCTMYDNTSLALETYPDHQPLNLRVDQTVFAFDGAEFRNFVAFRFDIANVGRVDIEDVYIGFMVDCDIGPRDREFMARDDHAGFWSGSVLATDGLYTQVNVAYMHDGAEVDPLPGYFGLMFFDAYMPRVQSFQVFSGNQSFAAGGDPTNDEERYKLMSRRQIDDDTPPDQPNDYRYMFSIAPWSRLAPRMTRRVYVAMVIGEGLEELLRHCADVKTAWSGVYFDVDGNPATGVDGKETRLCFDEYPPPGHSIYTSYAHFMSGSCGPIPWNWPMGVIEKEDFTHSRDGYCIWVNNDGCEECARLAGMQCTWGNGFTRSVWNCNRSSVPAVGKIGCTGIYGAETRVPWVVTHLPPPPPNIRVWPRSDAVHVYWDDSSEYVNDLQLQMVDFESYRVLRADNWERPLGTSLNTGPGADLWRLIAEYDIDNQYTFRYYQDDNPITVTLDLGMNTGLEGAVYTPACLADPRFEGLAEAMQDVVNLDVGGYHRLCPPLRDALNRVIPGYEGLLPWESYEAELDTFYMATPREAAEGVVGKHATRFYEYIDTEVHNGFLYFYAVTATDHAIDWVDEELVVTGSGLIGSPAVSFVDATPGTEAQTVGDRDEYGANIFVYPNPVTRESLAEFQQLNPNTDDPTGVKVMFANLPRSLNRVSIYTLAGDLVDSFRHDGRGGHGEAGWNLVSRSGQQIVSGIYLYVVESDDDRYKPFTGRFVVIK